MTFVGGVACITRDSLPAGMDQPGRRATPPTVSLDAPSIAPHTHLVVLNPEGSG